MRRPAHRARTRTHRHGRAEPSALADLIRGGRITVGFNTQAISLVQWNDRLRALSGVNPDLANELARRLAVRVADVEYDGATPLFDAGRRGMWDVAFAVIDPAQSGIAFTAPYLDVEYTYLVPRGSPIRAAVDADAPAIRIAMFGGSVAERYLSGTLGRAVVVKAASTLEAMSLVDAGRADIVAGSRQELVGYLDRWPGGRVLDDSFTRNRWAIAVASGRADLLAYTSDFVERAKASGFVASSIAANGLTGIRVAPKGP